MTAQRSSKQDIAGGHRPLLQQREQRDESGMLLPLDDSEWIFIFHSGFLNPTCETIGR
jgi:hypothetical protein